MGRRKKGLSPEDRELWDRVKRSAKPLGPAAVKQRVEQKGAPRASESDAEEGKAAPIAPFRIGEAAGMSTAPVPPPETGRPGSPPVRMQGTAHRRMIRGKLKPEARLDLHGMTLADAHPALIRFVMDAYDRGLRLLLVITGKGRGGGDDDGPVPARRGVLRRQVPHWLAAPPIGAVVLEVREAHQRHGGGGAYYVYLKRRR